MNIRLVLRQIGLLLVVLAGIMVALAGFSAMEMRVGKPYEREALQAFVASAIITALSGGILWAVFRRHHLHLGRRAATLLVVASWVIGALFCALPYWMWYRFIPPGFEEDGYRSYMRCLFEAVSGLTTCGATVLTDIQSLPRSILLWRATTQWIGGLGIIVLFVAVLPSLGAAGKRMFLTESTGVTPEGLRPHVRETARILWLLYLSLTIVQALLLKLAGMSVFDAVNHSFATIATGGFSSMNASIAAYNSWAIDILVILFMFLGGVNFALFYRCLRGQYRAVLRDTELHWYLGMLIVATVVVGAVLMYSRQPIVTVAGVETPPTVAESARHAAFVVTSMQTTTGFLNADYERWPVLAKGVILFLAFVGGCGGSTSSGVKVIRVVIAFKSFLNEVERDYRPAVIRPLKIGNSVIDLPVRTAAIAVILSAIFLIGVGTVVLLLVESDPRMNFTTAASASLANLLNIGPGLGAVGAAFNYGWMSEASLATLMPLMVLGRLEIFAVVALFTRRFWRGQ